MKLATASEMQQLDRTAIEQYSIPGMVLMENAGHGTYSYMVDELGPVKGKSAVIFTGPGNNGGDGLVIARHIHQAGGYPFIVFLAPPEKLKGDAAKNFNIVNQMDIPHVIIQEEADIETSYTAIMAHMAARSPWSMVDAIFGTGLQRELSGRFLDAVRLINKLRKKTGVPVTAVDIPSGLNSDTGQILGASVHADLTATYGLAKPGHFMHGGGLVGKLKIVDIGIPDNVVAEAGLRGEVVDQAILDKLGNREQSVHKGNYGHLLVIAGSEGKTGAAILSCSGALRIGTGLVSLLAPEKLNPVFESALAEAMTIPLPRSQTMFTIEDIDIITKQMEGKSALAIGPGLGTDNKTAELVINLYSRAEIPMVVDADALNILALSPGVLEDPPAPRILTPHPGEMARLIRLSTKEIQANRLEAARTLAELANRNKKHVTVVLKGAGTIIYDPAGTWAINTSGNPGMAAGGMGDVLTGLIGGLLAQRMEPANAARLAVYLHGRAADRLSKKRKFGYLASEVAAEIPELVTQTL